MRLRAHVSNPFPRFGPVLPLRHSFQQRQPFGDLRNRTGHASRPTGKRRSSVLNFDDVFHLFEVLFRVIDDRAPHGLILGQLGVHNDGRLIAAEHGVQRVLNLLFQLAFVNLLVFQMIARRAHQPIILLGEQGAGGVRDGHIVCLQPTDRVGHNIGNPFRLPPTQRAAQLKRNGRLCRLGFPSGKHALLRERDQDLGRLHLVIGLDDACQILLQRDLLVQVDLLLAHHAHIAGATRHKGVAGHLVRGHDILLRE